MEQVNTIANMEWQIALETALTYGINKLAAAKAERERLAVARQAEIRMAWEVFSAELRAALPAVLQPLMNDQMMNDQMMNDEGPVRGLDELVIINGEAYGLAPIAVHLSRKGKASYEVACFEVSGVFRYLSEVHNSQRLLFGWGDECWLVNPCIHYDVEVTLARAMETMVEKMTLEEKPMLSEPEYEAAGEEQAVGIANKAMDAAIRAIVRDELRTWTPD